MIEHIEYDDPNSITYEIEDGEIYFVVGPPIDFHVFCLVPLSAAVEANLNAGDVILEINGEPIKKFNQLKEAVENLQIFYRLKVWRDAKIFQTTIIPKREDIPNLKAVL